MIWGLWLKLTLWISQKRAVNQTDKDDISSLQHAVTGTINSTAFMAIDLEMTGLDPKVDQIISIGIVPIYQGRIILAKAQHIKVAITGSVGISAVIHGIVDHQLDQAITIDEALTWLIEQTRGYVLIAHHAQLDLAFIQQQLKQHTGRKRCFAFIDTLGIEKNRWLRQHNVIKEGCLRLGASRQRYGLPVYSAHNALVDAVACAELFLAQLASMGNVKKSDLIALSR